MDGACCRRAGKTGQAVQRRGSRAASQSRVLVPVVKTAKGDLSYPVVLKYGGKLPALSPLAAVQFPLVREVKSYPRGTAINIERSQLQLYLPRSHDWYGFGGTLHPADEGQQQTARISALNELGGRLMEAARDKDPFTRLRASTNLKNWIAQSRNVQAGAGRRDGELQREIAANGDALNEASRIVVAGTPIAPGQAETVADNRQRLNDLYGKQIVKNAAGTLELNGANSYSGGTTISPGTVALQGGGEFNGNWIDRNNLNGGHVIVHGEQSLPNGTKSPGEIAASNSSGFNFNDAWDAHGNKGQGGYGGRVAGAGNITMNAQSNAPASQAAANPNAFFNYNRNALSAQQSQSTLSGNGTVTLGNSNASSGPAIVNGGVLNGQMGQQGGNQQSADQNNSSQQSAEKRSGNPDQQQKELEQYQEKLASGNGSGVFLGPQLQAGKSEKGADEAGRREGIDRAKEATSPALPEVGQSAAGLTSTFDATPQAAPAAVLTAPAGLASLDFQLPTDTSLYQVYRFSTPLGAAELTARTISTSTVARLQSLAAIVVALMVLWLAVTLVRRGALGCFRHPLGATLLLLIGIVMLCGGVLPVIALAGIVAGIWLLIARLVARKRFVAAV